MRPKDWIDKKAQEAALKAYGATQLNNNQETSPYFVGKISADRSTITDPTGRQYRLQFTGNPSQFELAERISNDVAVVHANVNRSVQVDGNNTISRFLYLKMTGVGTFIDDGLYMRDCNKERIFKVPDEAYPLNWESAPSGAQSGTWAGFTNDGRHLIMVWYPKYASWGLGIGDKYVPPPEIVDITPYDGGTHEGFQDLHISILKDIKLNQDTGEVEFSGIVKKSLNYTGLFPTGKYNKTRIDQSQIDSIHNTFGCSPFAGGFQIRSEDIEFSGTVPIDIYTYEFQISRAYFTTNSVSRIDGYLSFHFNTERSIERNLVTSEHRVRVSELYESTPNTNVCLNALFARRTTDDMFTLQSVIDGPPGPKSGVFSQHRVESTETFNPPNTTVITTSTTLNTVITGIGKSTNYTSIAGLITLRDILGEVEISLNLLDNDYKEYIDVPSDLGGTRSPLQQINQIVELRGVSSNTTSLSIQLGQENGLSQREVEEYRLMNPNIVTYLAVQDASLFSFIANTEEATREIKRTCYLDSAISEFAILPIPVFPYPYVFSTKAYLTPTYTGTKYIFDTKSTNFIYLLTAYGFGGLENVLGTRFPFYSFDPESSDDPITKGPGTAAVHSTADLVSPMYFLKGINQQILGGISEEMGKYYVNKLAVFRDENDNFTVRMIGRKPDISSFNDLILLPYGVQNDPRPPYILVDFTV